MQKLPNPIMILLNRYGFLTLPLIPLLILLVVLGSNGFTALDPVT